MWFRRYQRFDRIGGGLVIEPMEQVLESAPLLAPGRFDAPAWIDSRAMCLLADDQGQEPACTGFAMAGWLEVQHWRTKHYQQTFDALKLYRKAKELDKIKESGTTLQAVAEAAKVLGFVDQKAQLKTVKSQAEVMYALHQYGVCLGAFEVTEAWHFVDRKSGFIHKTAGNRRGGHAVLLCQYCRETTKDGLLAGIGWQNSWGASWGHHGFGRMSWDQFTQTFYYGLVIT
jgi:hypothetical protein